MGTVTLATTGLTVVGLSVPLEVVVLGVLTGLTYALLAVGLILAYKATRVLNFAHGEMGALAAGVMPVLTIRDHWPYWATLLTALAVAAATGIVMEFGVVRRFARSSRLIVLVATIGAAQLFFAVGTFIPKGEKLGSATFPTPFRATVTVGSLHLTAGDVLILLTVPLIAAALAILLNRTSFGLAIRAAGENPDAAQLAGISIRRVSLAVWITVGVLAGVSAILTGPTRPVVTQAALGPDLLVRGLAAAMLAGLSSLPQAFAGGITLGVVEAVIRWNYPSGSTLEVVLFALIIGSLLLRRGLGKLAREGETSSWSLTGRLRSLPPPVALVPKVRIAKAGLVTGLVLAAGIFGLAATNSQRVLMSSVVLFGAMGLSLVVLTGFAGQVSLGQFAFVGLGAIIGGRVHQLGFAPWMCIIYATVAGGLVAFVVGLPALRIRGLFLAVVTLAFAVAVNVWSYNQHWLVHINSGGSSLQIPRPRLLGISFQSELRYYWLSLAVLLVLATVVNRVRLTGVGRAMMAVRDNEAAAATLGISPRRVKLTAFVLAGMMAAFAGYFYGGLLVSFPSADTFAPELSLALVGLVILGGVTTVTGAVLGGLWLQGLAYVLGPVLPQLVGSSLALLIGGVGLLAALYQFPSGIAEVAFKIRDTVVRRLVPDAFQTPPAATPRTGQWETPAKPRSEGHASGMCAIGAKDIVVRFGGNLVLDRVSLEAAPGEIVGLAGPNGAGKTTLFDVLSGQIRPQSGQVLLDGVDVTWVRPDQRARLGLGRTFQQARLFDEMPLLQTVELSLERHAPSEVVPSVLGLLPSRRTEASKAASAKDILELLGLAPLADRPVGELSTGTRRIAELACMIGLGARVLLFDEPTAGIAAAEAAAFPPVLRQLRDELDATIVVIEHDIPLLVELVDRLYVLASGRLLAEGPPREVRTERAVVDAYLGVDGAAGSTLELSVR